MKFVCASAAALTALLVAGCQTTKPLYNYGSYQSNLYEHFKGDDAAVLKQIENLEKTIAESNAKNLNIAPGIYAHLGYLYLQTGQADTGFSYFNKEKETYPESAQYIDFLMKNAKAGKK